jgi:hypothetical protein
MRQGELLALRLALVTRVASLRFKVPRRRMAGAASSSKISHLCQSNGHEQEDASTEAVGRNSVT